jgi:aerobic-type carbon monoxide dehydrogenase small subunit (CoxS/CutS family)
MTLAVECDGAEIETAEGIAKTDHPLVEKYVENHCMQCGYCTPGFVVTSKALLDKNPNPTAKEVQQALAGNLCRCGTYPQHTKAVLETAEILARQRREASNE